MQVGATVTVDWVEVDEVRVMVVFSVFGTVIVLVIVVGLPGTFLVLVYLVTMEVDVEVVVAVTVFPAGTPRYELQYGLAFSAHLLSGHLAPYECTPTTATARVARVARVES